VGGKGGEGDRGEKWPKHCMHIWIIKQLKKKKLMLFSLRISALLLVPLELMSLSHCLPKSNSISFGVGGDSY
jgi:hypothetical protein